jgi:23S rRNA pseudouridine2605 synthase
MTHPSKHVPKTYRVTVRHKVTEEMLVKFSTGIEIDGRMTAPVDAHVIQKEEGRVVLEMVLHEGRNRQIRKMCEAMGLEVARLKRTAIGSIKLGMLKQGAWRELNEDEVRKLMIAADMDRKKK